jgi:cell division septation protein DedD
MARAALFGPKQEVSTALPVDFSRAERNLLARSGSVVADPTVRQAISDDSGLVDRGLVSAEPLTAPDLPSGAFATQVAVRHGASPAAQMPASPPPVDAAPLPLRRLAAAEHLRATAPSAPAVVLQLGAYSSESRATEAWLALRERHAAIIGSLRNTILVASVPERGTLYRLRVGPFVDRATAFAACEMLKAEGAPCLVAQRWPDDV